MKIGQFTCGYQYVTLEEAFADAKRFGYDYVEVSGQRPHTYAPDLKAGGINEVKRLAEKYEMPIHGYSPELNGYPHNFMIGDEAQRKDAIEHIKLCMDMSKEMGAGWTLVSPGHAGFLPTGREIWDRLIKSLQELVDYGEKIGNTVMLESLTPFESNVLNSVNQVTEVMDAIPSDRLMAMCDIVPPYVISESIMSYYRKLGDKLAHFHIIDGDKVSDTHLCPGEGTLPLRELMLDLKESGFKGTATIELCTNYIYEPTLYARRAIETLRSYM